MAVLLILRRSYQRGRRIFPNLSMSKVKKKTLERSIVINCSFLFSQKTIKIKQFIYPTTCRRRLDNSVSVKYTGQASQYFLDNNNTNTSVSRAFRLLVSLSLFPFKCKLEVIIDYGSAFVTRVEGVQFPGRDAPDKINRGG